MVQTKENNAFDALKQHECISLTTYRKNGKPVPTPVWFALENDKLYVSTELRSGKVKRIRNNPNVQVAPCTQRGKLIGPTMEGVARILPSDHKAQVKAALKRKYGWLGVWAILSIKYVARREIVVWRLRQQRRKNKQNYLWA